MTFSGSTPNSLMMMSLTRASVASAILCPLVPLSSIPIALNPRASLATPSLGGPLVLHHHATVHGDHLSRNVPRPWPGEEASQLRHVARLA